MCDPFECRDRLKTQRDEALARAAEFEGHFRNTCRSLELQAENIARVGAENAALRAELAVKAEALQTTRAKLVYPSWKSETEYLRIIDRARAVVDSALADSPKAGG